MFPVRALAITQAAYFVTGEMLQCNCKFVGIFSRKADVSDSFSCRAT